MSGNKPGTIKDFFKPAQTPASQPTSSDIVASSSKASGDYRSSTPNTKEELELNNQRPSSSLSPPPSSHPFSNPLQTSQSNSRPPTYPGNGSSTRDREIKGSDDEDSDSDSDSSFPELSTIFGHGNSTKVPSSATTDFTPSTPATSRIKKPQSSYISPLAVLPKYRFDLKSLVSHAEADDAAEASSKRLKAMLASSENENDPPVFASEGHVRPTSLAAGGLLESVVAEQEEGGMQKVTRALMRTEATHAEKGWYFFDTDSQAPASPRKPLPTKLLRPAWRKELSNPKTRDQTFISGFAEDMVSFGESLPDEVFLWILDEACFESNDVLRISYFNVVAASSEQIRRLLSPGLIKNLFQALRATSVAITVTETILPSSALKDPYPNYDWANLRSTIRFLGRVAKELPQKSKEYCLCLLLRMSADHVACKTLDILDVFQETIRHLCQNIPDETWGTLCQTICKLMFDSIKQPPLRLQIIDSIPSTNPRTHDLRRRLAMCFFFNNLSYSTSPPHTTTNLNSFIDRLEEADFNISSRTDYQQLSALVSLLDIAVDDGRSINVNLTDENAAETFNEDVDALVETIRDIMRGIGNPGAAYISRIEAKEGLELVNQRISDTLRTKPKRRAMHFDIPRGKAIEDLGREKAGMSAFLSKIKGSRDGG